MLSGKTLLSKKEMETFQVKGTQVCICHHHNHHRRRRHRRRRHRPENTCFICYIIPNLRIENQTVIILIH